MQRPAVLIRPISIGLKRIWPVCSNLNLGLIWVGRVYIKSHFLPSLILFHILLVGVFPSLLNSMVKILVRLGSMLANMSCNWGKRVLMMLSEFACFLCL